MRRILLINPNISQNTTDAMLAIARTMLPPDFEIVGATARRGARMIMDPSALALSVEEVVGIGQRRGQDTAGIIIGAFGDPGVGRLRRLLDCPVVGIGEAAMLEAASPTRRFGVATVTPGLVATIDDAAAMLRLGSLYTGVRLTAGDPALLMASPEMLLEALARAVSICIQQDRAEAVVIGGGPLGDAAIALARMFEVPIIAPIPAAVRQLLALIKAAG